MLGKSKNAKAKKNPLILTGNGSSAAAREAYRRLYRRLLKVREERGVKTVALTSPQAAEGKSLVSVNLALTMTEDPGTSVALLDCDFRTPTVARYLGLDGDKGLAEVAQGKHELEEVVQAGVEGRPNLSVIPAGRLEGEISPELYSKKLLPIVRGLKERFDFVILDTPPVVPVADQDFLSDCVDGIVLVVRTETTTRAMLEAARESIQPEKLLGMIVNGVPAKKAGYYYYYHYNHNGSRG